MKARSFLLFGLACGLASSAAAQSARFLTPDSFRSTVGMDLPIRITERSGAELVPQTWPTRDLRWAFWRVGGTQENRDRLQPENESASAVSIPIDHSGVAMIGIDLLPRESLFKAEPLEAFLRDYVGLKVESVRDEAQRPRIPVQWQHSMKTLVVVAGKDGKVAPSSVAQSKSGQVGEIRLMADPSSVPVGSDLPLRVYFGGSSSAGAMVTATHLPTGKRQSFRTKDGGLGHFGLTASGAWTVEAHWASPMEFVKAEGPARAGWQIRSASLSFEIVR